MLIQISKFLLNKIKKSNEKSSFFFLIKTTSRAFFFVYPWLIYLQTSSGFGRLRT